KAMVLCVDEKSQIQALDRPQPALPMMPGVPERRTHETPTVRRWLARHSRFTVHFTPTSSSWVNQVERSFATLTERQIRSGTHRSTIELERATKRRPSSSPRSRPRAATTCRGTSSSCTRRTG
ncbi:MAG: hypothetical protein ACK53C_15685, partial [Pseudomonadota bacterium]